MLCPNCNSYQHETKKTRHCQICGFVFGVEVPRGSDSFLQLKSPYKYRIDCSATHAQVFTQSIFALKQDVIRLFFELEKRVPQGSDDHLALAVRRHNIRSAETLKDVQNIVEGTCITITVL